MPLKIDRRSIFGFLAFLVIYMSGARIGEYLELHAMLSPSMKTLLLVSPIALGLMGAIAISQASNKKDATVWFIGTIVLSIFVPFGAFAIFGEAL